MVFSNNSEYDDTEAVPLEGAFYSTISYEKLFFSHFREEDEKFLTSVPEKDEAVENFILTDNNLSSIKYSPEYVTNSSPVSPTNRIITSLFSFERILTFLKYAIAYVERTDENGITHLEKHLMRYPQFFATKAIENKLNAGVKNGIIWHTQGSGKTALAYYNVRYLTDYYQKHGTIAKFYFIVDRLDLLTQAANEFRARGLHVEEINSKEDFIKNIHSTGTVNNTGKPTITVVNIQKFSKESIAKQSDYAVNVQRIYFLDEAHRSYKPTGSFLANLLSSDREAVMIALTGTPLIGTIYDDDGKPIAGKKYDSKSVFGNYIHKYYYNRSIADGYTLKLIREGIETTYKKKLQKALEEIEMLKGSLDKKEMYAHPKYVSALVEYITDDFRKSRIAMNDESIGGMIVCDSSEQARAIFEELKSYPYSAALILHDADDKETRKDNIDAFKKGTIDFLVVYNMLLTGFDAPRLKKLYLGRVIKDHNLLQALTRVNRPYKNYRYGYVVDFADIRAEFDKTNKAYFDELRAELGDEFKQYDNIFKSPETCVYTQPCYQAENEVLKFHMQEAFQRIQMDTRPDGFATMIMDELNQDKVKQLKDACHRMMVEGDFVKYENVYHGVLTECSSQSTGIQLADYAVGIMNCYLRKHLMSRGDYTFATDLYTEFVLPHLRKHANGTIVGYGVREVPSDSSIRQVLIPLFN